MRRFEVALLLAWCALIGSSVQAQQGEDGMIVGTVRDGSGGAIPHATLIVSGATLIGGARATTADDGGRYRFPALTPGSYDVTVRATGFRTQQRTVASLLPGATVTLDASLDLDTVVEIVNVSSAAPSAIDVRTSAALTVIPRDILDNLPLSRTVTSFVNLAPGVIKNAAFGGSRSANPFSLDGANGNEPGWGTPVTAPSASWLEELQVISVGADAQYGEFTGVLSNARTRSGSNRFSGEFDFWRTPRSGTANNRGGLPADVASRFRPLDILNRWSATEQVGGPIRKDTLWFFGGLDVYRNESRPSGFASVSNPPEDAIYSVTEPKVFGKLTGAVAPAVRLEGYAGYDLSKSSGANASPVVKPDSLASDRRPETLWNTRLTWTLRERTLFEVRHGGYRTQDFYGPADPARRAGPSPHWDLNTNVLSVNTSGFRDDLYRVWSTSISATRYWTGSSGGSHQLKGGFEYESDRLRNVDGTPGDMGFYDRDGQTIEVAIQAPVTYRPDHRRQTFYAQDNWNATGVLTINAGVRAGRYSGAIEGMPEQFSAGSLSPRIGIAWDVLRDHTLAVRGHYGRYHDAMVTSFYDFLDPLSQPTFIYASVIGPDQYSEIYRIQSLNGYSIDPAIKYPFADEWVASAERALSSRMSLTAQYIHRTFGAIIGFTGPMSVWLPVQQQDPGPDGQLGTADDAGLMTIYFNDGTQSSKRLLTNPDGAYKRYDGFQLIATRRANEFWQGYASYSWSRTRASFDNAFSSNAANNDLSVNGVYVNPNRALFAEGRTASDFTHELKIVGTTHVRYWGGFRVSGVYRYQSGTPWARLVSFSGPTQLGAELVEPRGTRVTPATNVCDLRIEKTFRVARASIAAYLDVFNVGNQGIANAYVARSGPIFGTPQSWSDPRTVRLGARLIF